LFPGKWIFRTEEKYIKSAINTLPCSTKNNKNDPNEEDKPQTAVVSGTGSLARLPADMATHE